MLRLRDSFRLTAMLASHGISPLESAHVFDLDDTLLMTKQLVIVAYERAGETRARVEENWGRSWSEWTTIEVHELKNKHYNDLLLEGKVPLKTVLFEAARSGMLGDDCSVLTGASRETYGLLQSVIGHLPRNMGCGVSHNVKPAHLYAYAQRVKKPIIYYDDSAVSMRGFVDQYKDWDPRSKEESPLYLATYTRDLVPSGMKEILTVCDARGEKCWTVSF